MIDQEAIPVEDLMARLGPPRHPFSTPALSHRSGPVVLGGAVRVERPSEPPLATSWPYELSRLAALRVMHDDTYILLCHHRYA